VVTEPEIYARGFIYSEDAEFGELRALATRSLERAMSKGVSSADALKARLKEDISSVIAQKTRRKPVIIAVITEAEL